LVLAISITPSFRDISRASDLGEASYEGEAIKKLIAFYKTQTDWNVKATSQLDETLVPPAVAETKAMLIEGGWSQFNWNSVGINLDL
jgi:hypothetical protein